jgi:hypothetical protein
MTSSSPFDPTEISTLNDELEALQRRSASPCSPTDEVCIFNTYHR